MSGDINAGGSTRHVQRGQRSSSPRQSSSSARLLAASAGTGADADDDAPPPGRCARCCCSPWFCVPLGAFLLALSIAVLLVTPWFIDLKIRQELSLESPRTIMYNGFRNQSEDVTVDFVYSFFNVTNFHAVEHGGAIPNLTVHGPYVYRRVKWRPEDRIYWDTDGVVHYRTLQRYVFDAEASGGGRSEADVVVTPRAGIFLAIQRSKGSDFLVDLMTFLLSLDNITSMFQARNISDLVHGYSEPFLEPFRILGVSPVVGFGRDVVDIDKAPESAIYGGGERSATANASDYTWRRDFPWSLGQYAKWEGHAALPYWRTEFANMINGSDGSMFPPRLDKYPALNIYVDNLHRSLRALHSADVDFHGISLRRYTLDPASLAAASSNPDNWAFGISETGLQPYPPIKGCDDEFIMAVLGKPFYLGCNTSSVHVAMPRNATAALDDSHLDIEPRSGILMRVRNQLMASVKLRPVSYVLANGTTHRIEVTRNLSATWLPVFTASEEYHLGPEMRDRVKLEILLPMSLTRALGIPLMILGSAILLWRLLRCVQKRVVGEAAGNTSKQ